MHTLREEDFTLNILEKSFNSDQMEFYNKMLNYVPSTGNLIGCEKCHKSWVTLYKINNKYYCKDCKKELN